MNMADTMMSGRVGPDHLAGVAIGSSLWMPIFAGLNGILLSVTPIVAQLIGANKSNEASHSILQAIYISLVISISVMMLGAFFLNPILNQMSLEENVRNIAHDYLVALSFGIIPLFAYNVLRSFIDALGHTRISMIITLISLPINVFFNYLLIFGKFGFPALGGVGAGYATAITYWLALFIAFFIVHRLQPFQQYQVFRKLVPISLKKWKEIFIIGLPIGFSIFFETSIFAAVTLFMSTFDTNTIAAHQAAINFTSLLYMFPLSASMALTILVGFEVGAKRYKDAKIYSWLGISLSLVMAVISAIILYQFRIPIAGLYSTNIDVIELTTVFLLYALFFQVSDAIQASVQGSLRGYKDVNITFFMTLLSYWIIGLPLGYWFANYTSLGAYGYWIGLIAGLTAGAIGLSARLLYIQKKYKKEMVLRS